MIEKNKLRLLVSRVGFIMDDISGMREANEDKVTDFRFSEATSYLIMASDILRRIGNENSN